MIQHDNMPSAYIYYSDIFISQCNCVPQCCCFILFVFHRFFELFEKHGGYKSGKLKLKKPKQLQVSETGFSLFFIFPHSLSSVPLFLFCSRLSLFRKDQVMFAHIEPHTYYGSQIIIVLLSKYLYLTV